MRVMKYFRHILIGNEIFFKIFDDPQNIFLYSIFAILSFKLRGLEHKISKLVVKEIYERNEMLNKITSNHPLSRYKAKGSKNKKTCLIHF